MQSQCRSSLRGRRRFRNSVKMTVGRKRLFSSTSPWLAPAAIWPHLTLSHHENRITGSKVALQHPSRASAPISLRPCRRSVNGLRSPTRRPPAAVDRPRHRATPQLTAAVEIRIRKGGPRGCIACPSVAWRQFAREPLMRRHVRSAIPATPQLSRGRSSATRTASTSRRCCSMSNIA